MRARLTLALVSALICGCAAHEERSPAAAPAPALDSSPEPESELTRDVFDDGAETDDAWEEPLEDASEETGAPDYARWAREDKALKTPASKGKAAMAVAPFTFRRSVRAQPGAELETATLTNKFITQLGQVRKFDVVERDQLDRLLEEMQLSESGLTDPRRAVKAGKMYGVDYFLMGEISVFTVTTRVKPVPRTRRFNRTVELRLIADMRIVDSRTSAIVATGKGDVSRRWRKMYTSRPVANAPVEPSVLDEIQRDLCSQLVRDVVDAVFPIYVLRLNATGTVFLNRGAGGGMKAGDQYDVFRPGEALIDPDTGENLGSEETKVSRIEITDALAKFSKAAILGGRPRKGYLCRPASGAPRYFIGQAPRPPARDTTAPRIYLLSPADGQVVDAAPVDIRIEVTDDKRVARVTINDAEVKANRGQYRARMSRPKEGQNQVRIEAWDSSGNKAQIMATFTYAPAPPPDTEAPRVRILAPRQGQQINSAPVWVVVSAKDDTGVARVQINGVDAQRGAKGRYSARISSPEAGRNDIRVLADDAAGNRGSAQSQFVFDATAPAVEAQASILVEGTVDDLGATLTINGAPIEFDRSSGRYAVRVPTNPEDPGKIVIVATDEFGNQSREVRKIR